MSDTTENIEFFQKIVDLFNKIISPKTELNFENLNEVELIQGSDNFFKDLFNNLLYFHKLNNKIIKMTKEDKFFFTEILEILYLIEEDNQEEFLSDQMVQSTLIYLVYSFKEPMNLSYEIIINIFWQFKDSLLYIKSKIIQSEKDKFENDLVNIMHKLIGKYIADHEINLKFLLKKSKLSDIIKGLRNHDLPLYLNGYKKLNDLTKIQEYLSIKIYKYFELNNPFNKNTTEYYVFQGYILNEVLTYLQVQSWIDFSKYNEIKQKRIRNNNAKEILILAVKLLSSKKHQDFMDILENENINILSAIPTISDNFDNTNEYYKELYDQLIYSLSQYKTKKQNSCIIITDNYSRILWLNYCKLLLLYVEENDIRQNCIKIIFYMIVDLFSPETVDSCLQLRDDAVPTFFSLIMIDKKLLVHQQIFKVFDKKFSNFYFSSACSKKINLFAELFEETSNSEILADKDVQILLKKNNFLNIEVNNIKTICKNLPFPLIRECLGEKSVPNLKGKITPNLYSFYEKCFLDINDENEQKTFINKIKEIHNSERKLNYDDIESILLDNEFLNLVDEIMKSKVLKDAYEKINEFYEKNGKLDIVNEELYKNSKEKDNSINEEKNNKNLINNKNIKYYYNSFCNVFKSSEHKNRFIVMNLPQDIKGFTFRFLKIVVNCNGIKIEQKSEADKTILLKAYLIFVLVHEQNHFIKRYFNLNSASNVCLTPKLNGVEEGGKQLIELLFGHYLIENIINIEQANYILDINNWGKKSVYDFRNDFNKINKDKRSNISYLSSGSGTFCDHSKLRV